MMLISVLVIAATMAYCANGHSCGERMYEHLGQCCDMCRPGQYVVKHCSAYNFTICESCQVGTVMKTHNDKTECDDCPTRQYYDVNFLHCMQCKWCNEGDYPAEECSTLHNTKCQECPENHFSNLTENQNTSCKACTKCKRYKSKCTKEQDAVCDDVPQTTMMPTEDLHTTTPKLIVLKSSTEKTSSPIKNESSSQTGSTFLIILTVVLIIVFVLVIIVVYWCARRKSRCQGGDGFLVVPRSLKYEPLRTGLLLRNQSASFFMKLVELLNPEGRPNWKDLAANFKDFSWDEIANFAVDKATAAEKMLCAWQTKNSSTVDKLYECSLNIKREDVATFVADSVTGGTDTLV